jgi:hypothetical protein
MANQCLKCDICLYDTQGELANIAECRRNKKNDLLERQKNSEKREKDYLKAIEENSFNNPFEWASRSSSKNKYDKPI